MLSIQTNVAALSAQNNLTATNSTLQRSMERLSSGFRINRAADDAAGLAISQRMQAQIGGLNQAVRNANDGVSLIQTSEGALDQVQTMMQRMRNLAVQAASDTNGTTERQAINVELQQIKEEIDNISNRTTFNGLGLLNGSLVTSQNKTSGTVHSGFAVGTTGSVANIDVAGAKAATTYTFTYSSAANTLTLSDGTNSANVSTTAITIAAGSSTTLNFGSLGVKLSVGNSSTTAAITGATVGTALTAGTIITNAGSQSAVLQTGADATTANTTTVTLLDTRLTGGSATQMSDLLSTISTFNTQANAGTITATHATDLITDLDAALTWISSQRAGLGAVQNRLGYAAASLSATAQNVAAANSQIRDVDVASETSTMSKSQILTQAGVSVLAQANQISQLALKLLNG